MGVITDGDLRRGMVKNKATFLDLKASDLMTVSPLSVQSEVKLKAAEELMMERKVNTLLVVEDNKCIGVLQVYDL